MFIAQRGRSELTTLILTGEQVADLVERMLRTSGRRIDLSTPFVDSTSWQSSSAPPAASGSSA